MLEVSFLIKSRIVEADGVNILDVIPFNVSIDDFGRVFMCGFLI